MTYHPQPPEEPNIEDKIEQLFLDRIKVIDNNEFTLNGSPAELIAALTALLQKETAKARVDELARLRLIGNLQDVKLLVADLNGDNHFQNMSVAERIATLKGGNIT